MSKAEIHAEMMKRHFKPSMGFVKLWLGVHRTPVINLGFVISLLDYYGDGETLLDYYGEGNHLGLVALMFRRSLVVSHGAWAGV